MLLLLLFRKVSRQMRLKPEEQAMGSRRTKPEKGWTLCRRCIHRRMMEKATSEVSTEMKLDN
jgi:hypothetical protein